MKIQVLGSGCQTCKRLYEITRKAAGELGIKEKVEYISGSDGIRKLVENGIMSSPALIVDGKVVMTGFTPDIEKIKSLIKKK